MLHYTRGYRLWSGQTDALQVRQQLQLLNRAGSVQSPPDIPVMQQPGDHPAAAVMAQDIIIILRMNKPGRPTAGTDCLDQGMSLPVFRTEPLRRHCIRDSRIRNEVLRIDLPDNGLCC